MEIYCVVTLVGLICKDISLAIVQFQGKLCPFVPKIFNSDGPYPMSVGSVIAKPNKSKEVEPLSVLAHQELEEEVLKVPITKILLPIISVLKKASM